jgi:hypothetical protein
MKINILLSERIVCDENKKRKLRELRRNSGKTI